MVYYPTTIYTLGWRRADGRPVIFYSGDNRLDALETLYRVIASGTVLCGRVIRRDYSPIFIVEAPVQSVALRPSVGDVPKKP